MFASNSSYNSGSSRLRVVPAIVALLMGGFGFGYAAVELWNSAGPRLSLAHEIIDLGDVPYGDTCTVVFALRNTGGADLNVRLAKVSCTCTIPDFDSSPIKPDEERSLILHTTAPTRQGEFGTDVVLETSDGRMPTVGLAVKGNAVSFVDVVPGFVSFGKPDFSDLPAERTILINRGKLANDTTLAGMHVETTDANIQASILDSANDTAVLAVRLQPGTPSGFYRRDITVAFASPKPYVIQIPVMAEVVGTLRAHPKSLYVGTLKKNETIERVVSISGLLPKDKLSIRPLSPALHRHLMLTLDEVSGDTRTLKITLSNPSGTAKSIIDSEIVLDVFNGSGGAAQSLAIPILGVLAGW